LGRSFEVVADGSTQAERFPQLAEYREDLSACDGAQVVDLVHEMRFRGRLIDAGGSARPGPRARARWRSQRS
jgi:hypothetical protein